MKTNVLSALVGVSISLASMASRAQEPSVELLRGDVNGDRKVTVEDAVHLQQLLLESSPLPSSPEAADADADGDLDQEDVVQILNRAAGAESLAGQALDSSGTGDLGAGGGSEAMEESKQAKYEWRPRPCSQEPQPCRPGPCEIEVRMEQVTVTDGQGISEGKLELNVVGTVDGAGSAVWPGALETQKVKNGHSKTIDDLVSVIQIGPNQNRLIEICAEVTEFDDGWLNGESDVGRECIKVPVSCDMGAQYVTLEMPLCRGDERDESGNCKNFNGRVAVEFSIKPGDADCDGVPNEQDFTPDPCDEENLGQGGPGGGRAVLVYFHFGDGGLNTLAQEVGVNLEKPMEGYEYVVLLKEDTDFAGLTLSAAAINRANLVLEPTKDNFWYAFRDIVSKGYNLDFYIYSHGNLDGSGGAFFEALDGTIDSADILANLGDPNVTGTRAIPILMGHSIACFHGALNQTWRDVGAKVVSGTIGFNFYPTFAGSFAGEWNAGNPHDISVVNSETALARVPVDVFIPLEAAPVLAGALLDGTLAGGCDPLTMTVLGQNPCAEWYFENGGAPAGGAYDFLGTYDPSESGLTNMRDASVRQRRGDGNLTKFTPGLTW